MNPFPKPEQGPASGAFVPAAWRGVTGPGPDGPVVGVSFDTPDGPLRLLLRVESAALLGRALAPYLNTRCQSPRSDGSPSVAVSTPEV